jgi:hypothetical protein
MRVTRLTTAALPLVAICHYDVTARKLAEDRAEYLALHDPLTGMANRRYFNLTMDRVIRSSVRDRSPIRSHRRGRRSLQGLRRCVRASCRG